MTGSYGQARFSLAWFENDFNSINVFVSASGHIDMIEIYTPPPTEYFQNIAEDNNQVAMEST
jgi:hypothetical protein